MARKDMVMVSGMDKVDCCGLQCVEGSYKRLMRWVPDFKSGGKKEIRYRNPSDRYGKVTFERHNSFLWTFLRCWMVVLFDSGHCCSKRLCRRFWQRCMWAR